MVFSPACRLLEFYPDLAAHDRHMTEAGFALAPRARLWRRSACQLALRLVWRNRQTGASVVLFVVHAVN